MQSVQTRTSSTLAPQPNVSQKSSITHPSCPAKKLSNLNSLARDDEKTKTSAQPILGAKKKAFDKTAIKNKLTIGLKLANPLKAKSNFFEKLTQKAADAGQSINSNKPSSWHQSRTYGEMPLTFAGVTTLQGDSRIDRRAGLTCGMATGALIGSAIGMPIFFTTGTNAGLAAFITLSVGGMAVGGIVGAHYGLPRGVHRDAIRTHGLFYTGIVPSKKLSAKIVKKILGNRIIASDAVVASTLRGAVASRAISLTDLQIEQIVQYYQFARDGLAG